MYTRLHVKDIALFTRLFMHGRKKITHIRKTRLIFCGARIHNVRIKWVGTITILLGQFHQCRVFALALNTRQHHVIYLSPAATTRSIEPNDNIDGYLSLVSAPKRRCVHRTIISVFVTNPIRSECILCVIQMHDKYRTIGAGIRLIYGPCVSLTEFMPLQTIIHSSTIDSLFYSIRETLESNIYICSDCRRLSFNFWEIHRSRPDRRVLQIYRLDTLTVVFWRVISELLVLCHHTIDT